VTELALGRVGDFEDGCVRLVEVEGRSIGVFRRGDELYAVLNVCPHRGAPVCAGEVSGTMLPSSPGELVYGMDGLVLRCPWHGWEFDLRTGDSVGGVDRRRLRTFPVQVRDGEVLARLEPGKGNERKA
jgi:nitrite reductase (NADH) small subunit